MPLRLARSGGRADLVIDLPPVNVLDGEALARAVAEFGKRGRKPAD